MRRSGEYAGLIRKGMHDKVMGVYGELRKGEEVVGRYDAEGLYHRLNALLGKIDNKN